MNPSDSRPSSDRFAIETVRFVEAARAAFRFLVDEHRFGEPAVVEENRDMWLDRRVAVRYLKRDAGVAIEVELRFADPAIGVALIALDCGEFPEKYSFYGDAGHQPAANLDSLVRYVTNDSVQPLLPWPEVDSSIRAIAKAMDARKALIEKDMEGILEQLAERLRRYAAAALCGDLSQFPAVVALHRRF